MTGIAGSRPAGLQAFAGGEPPAFASDASQRVRFWNAGAERLLQRPAGLALDAPCFEVVRGRDVFGNRFCYDNCALLAALRRGEAVRPFALLAPVRGSGCQHQLRVTPVRLQDERRQSFLILHILGSTRPSEPLAAEPPPPCGEPPLTAREREVLHCIAAGLQNKEIAERLRISPATVRNHVHHLLTKLHVHSKLHAASLAHRHGWSEPG
jgi:DNA-binding CsgD family transcriptional regulator